MRIKIFRALVCLVLVASLIVNISPIRTKAVSAVAPVMIDPDLAIAASLGGLGVMPGEDPTVHAGIVQDAINWLRETGDYISDGLFAYKVARATGDYSYFVEQDFLQELFDWMWDVEVVTGSGETLEFEGISAGLGNSASLYWAGSNYSISSDIPFAAYKVALYWESQYGNYHPSSFLVFTDNTGYYTFNGSTRNISSYAYRYGDMYIVHLGSWSTHKTLDDYNKCTGFADLGVQHYSDIQLFFEHFGGAVSFGNSVSTDKDLVLNRVGVFGSILPDVYTEWFQNSTTITDTETGEEKTVVPIGVESVAGTAAPDYDQEDIWTGTTPIIIPFPGTGTEDDSTEATDPTESVVVPPDVSDPSTDTDGESGDGTNIDYTSWFERIITLIEELPSKFQQWITDCKTAIHEIPSQFSEYFSNLKVDIQEFPSKFADFFSNVVSAVQTVPVAIKDFFTISAGDLALPVTWTDFFPFCIPSDIKAFVEVFEAEPEAPHFIFDVNFPYMNEPWHIDLDFSPWDPVALVLRRLEFLLFIVGLAMATRNYYIRG